MRESANAENGQPPTGQLTLGQLFLIFVKAGFAFGGGLGILAVLESELVERHRVIDREEFLATYGLGRIVPSGTMTALAVAFGHRWGGQVGVLVALSGLTLPAFVLTVILTMLYSVVRETDLLSWLEVSVLPAALALVVASAIKLGNNVFRPSYDLLLALLAFVAALLGINTALLLLLAGVAGGVVFRDSGGGGTT